MRLDQFVFRPGTVYEWRLDVTVSEIPEEELRRYLRDDARVIGILAEKVLAARFRNLRAAPTGGGSYDIVEEPVGGGLRSWEVKTAARGKAANLVPSAMNGVGRVVDEVKHEARRDGLNGYIVVDVSGLPQVRVIGLFMSDIRRLGYARRIKRKALDRLFARDLLTVGA